MTTPKRRPTGRYLVICTLDPERSAEVPALREAHLEHVGRHVGEIAYGGVIGHAPGPPSATCFVLDVDSRADAQRFVDADPYVDLYVAVSINPFTQRLPEPAKVEDAS